MHIYVLGYELRNRQISHPGNINRDYWVKMGIKYYQSRVVLPDMESFQVIVPILI